MTAGPTAVAATDDVEKELNFPKSCGGIEQNGRLTANTLRKSDHVAIFLFGYYSADIFSQHKIHSAQI